MTGGFSENTLQKLKMFEKVAWTRPQKRIAQKCGTQRSGPFKKGP